MKYRYTNVKQFIKASKDYDSFKVAVTKSSNKLLEDLFEENKIPLCNIIQPSECYKGFFVIAKEIGRRL